MLKEIFKRITGRKETPYVFARKLCSSCQWAEPENPLPGSDSYDIGCNAPTFAIPRVSSGRFDRYNETPIAPDKVLVDVIYVRQPGVLCIMPRPEEKGCQRAQIAEQARKAAPEYILPRTSLPELTKLFLYTEEG